MRAGYYAMSAKRDPIGLNEPEKTNNRDERFLRSVRSRGDQARDAAKSTRSRCCTTGTNAQGGALRRMERTTLAPSPEYEYKYVSVPGRYVPLGFARYVQPTINPNNYALYNVAAWRVAVPRGEPGFRVKDLLQRIFNYGPASAGYVRMGDMLVPAIEEPGDRMALAQSSINSIAFPLSQ